LRSGLVIGEAQSTAALSEQRLTTPTLPGGMRDAGTAMHHAAGRFAVTAQNASVTGDLKPVLAGLAEITAQCVGCHAGYRLKWRTKVRSVFRVDLTVRRSLPVFPDKRPILGIGQRVSDYMLPIIPIGPCKSASAIFFCSSLSMA
jgi:hypothetical protein